VLFAALGDETRMELVRRLVSGGPASITALAEHFAVSRQGVTKHLRVLEGAGVISGRRAGREHIWSLHRERLAEAEEYLAAIARGWDAALGRLKEFVESPS